MAEAVSVLYKKLNDLEQEIVYAQRKRKEEAEKTIKALKSISQEDAEIIGKFVPELKDVIAYTMEEVLENKHGEIQKIQYVYSAVRNLVETWLKNYEAALC